MITPVISDETVDALVELLFAAMPGVESAELVGFLNCILRIVEREARRTAAAVRRPWETPSEN
jgi:hypothetical protein